MAQSKIIETDAPFSAGIHRDFEREEYMLHFNVEVTKGPAGAMGRPVRVNMTVADAERVRDSLEKYITLARGYTERNLNAQ